MYINPNVKFSNGSKTFLSHRSGITDGSNVCWIFFFWIIEKFSRWSRNPAESIRCLFPLRCRRCNFLFIDGFLPGPARQCGKAITGASRAGHTDSRRDNLIKFLFIARPFPRAPALITPPNLELSGSFKFLNDSPHDGAPAFRLFNNANKALPRKKKVAERSTLPTIRANILVGAVRSLDKETQFIFSSWARNRPISREQHYTLVLEKTRRRNNLPRIAFDIKIVLDWLN